MIKFFGAFRHLPHLTNAQALEHYRTSHATAVLKAPEFRRNQIRYVQNWSVQDDPSLPAALRNPVMHGTAEAWHPSVEVMTQTFASPGYMEFIRPDEEKFIDVSQIMVMATEENVIFGGPNLPDKKLFTFLKRREGVSSAEAQAFWRDVYGPTLRNDSGTDRHMIGYVQNPALRNTTLPFELEVDYEGVDEVWFADVTDAGPYLEAETKVAKQIGAEKYFDPTQAVYLLTTPTEVPGFSGSR